jgi:hypothetical protein
MQQTISIEVWVMKIIGREFGYYQNKPVMLLRSAGRDNKKRFIIKLDDLWKYSDTHNDEFGGFITGKVLQICKLFDIEVPTRKRQFVQVMSSITDTIMDGIDDLVKMPPYREGHDDPDTVIDRQQPSDMPDIKVRLMQ